MYPTASEHRDDDNDANDDYDVHWNKGFESSFLVTLHINSRFIT
jgi:hypothetical protein